MYYPYLRGKQNELILLREQAELISKSKIIPIIEPVKKNLKPLNRAIDQLESFNTEYIYVVNPICGEFTEDNKDLINNIQKSENIIIGIIITAETNIDEIIRYLFSFSNFKLALLHQGFTDGKELASKIKDFNIVKHVFVNTEQNKLYQRQFKNQGDRILIRDSFRKTKNANYPKGEHFSDLHITYEEENMDGFGNCWRRLFNFWWPSICNCYTFNLFTTDG